jgi:hypothetical protein
LYEVLDLYLPLLLFMAPPTQHHAPPEDFVNAVSLAVSFRQDICGGLCLIFLFALYLTKA